MSAVTRTDAGRDLEAARQQAILAALFAADRAGALAAVSGARIRGSSGALAAGLGAYRGNGLAIAERALQATYPATFDLLGESASSAAAHLWRAEPPRSGDLADWGGGFADWLAAQPSLADWPQLAGCARIEWACHRAARAADAAMDVGSLALLGTHAAESLRLRLKPDVVVVRGAAGFHRTWLDASGREASAGPGAAAPSSPDDRLEHADGVQPTSSTEAVVVWREAFAPRVEPLAPAWAEWLDSALAGDALPLLLAGSPEPDLETTLAKLISRGWLLDILTTEDPA